MSSWGDVRGLASFRPALLQDAETGEKMCTWKITRLLAKVYSWKASEASCGDSQDTCGDIQGAVSVTPLFQGMVVALSFCTPIQRMHEKMSVERTEDAYPQQLGVHCKISKVESAAIALHCFVPSISAPEEENAESSG